MALPVPHTTDPDPTSQIPWPSGRKASGVSDSFPANDLHVSHPEANSAREPSKSTETVLRLRQDNVKVNVHTLKTLTMWNLFTLSLGMLGAQVAWTVELGYAYRFPYSIS